MTRTTDDLLTPERFQPLGAPIRKSAPTVKEEKPRGPSGIVVGSNGKMRTTTHPHVEPNQFMVDMWFDQSFGLFDGLGQ